MSLVSRTDPDSEPIQTRPKLDTALDSDHMLNESRFRTDTDYIQIQNSRTDHDTDQIQARSGSSPDPDRFHNTFRPDPEQIQT